MSLINQLFDSLDEDSESENVLLSNSIRVFLDSHTGEDIFKPITQEPVKYRELGNGITIPSYNLIDMRVGSTVAIPITVFGSLTKSNVFFCEVLENTPGSNFIKVIDIFYGKEVKVKDYLWCTSPYWFSKRKYKFMTAEYAARIWGVKQ